jgi:hypothetical protein
MLWRILLAFGWQSDKHGPMEVAYAIRVHVSPRPKYVEAFLCASSAQLSRFPFCAHSDEKIELLGRSFYFIV